MIWVKFFTLVCASVVVDVLGVILVPLALLVGGVNNRLPALAWLWDNDLEPFGDFTRRPPIEAATGFRKFWLRYMWLGWRNPGNNFSRLCGIEHMPDDIMRREGNQLTSDQNQQGRLYNRRYRVDGTLVGFELYVVWAWSASRCLRIRMGWKLDSNPAPLVHTVNPVMPFTGSL